MNVLERKKLKFRSFTVWQFQSFFVSCRRTYVLNKFQSWAIFQYRPFSDLLYKHGHQGRCAKPMYCDNFYRITIHNGAVG